MLTKKLAKELISVKGTVKGVVFSTDAQWIKTKHGLEGLRRVEQKLKSVNAPINYDKIISLKDYPVGLRAISLLAIKDVFKLSNKDLEQMGSEALKTSLIIRLALKYFISTRKAMSKASELWSKHYSVGRLIVKEVSSKRVIIHLEDLMITSELCIYLKGYFRSYIQLTRPNDKVKARITKYACKGENYTEFIFNW